MKKMRKIFSRVTAAVSAFALSVTTVLSSMPALTAEAATSVSIGYAWNSNINPVFKTAKYANSNGISGQYIRQGEQVTRFYATDNMNRFLFCIDPATHMGGVSAGYSQTESGYTAYDLDKEETSNTYWRTNFFGTGADKKNWQKYLDLVQYYGYGSHRGDNEKNAYYVATQLLIWEMVLGYRGHSEATFGTSTDVLWNDLTYPTNGITTQAATQAAYNDIVAAVKLHYTLPTGLYVNEDKAKENKGMMKYNSSTKRYEAKFTLPSSVVATNALRNWSNFRTELENTIKGKFNGTYGTNYGVSVSTSGSNTVYTVWSNVFPMNSNNVLSGYVEMIASPSVQSENTLFSKSGKQTCLFSPKSDPTSAYFALGVVNEPNITIEKVYTDAAGVKVTGTELTELLNNTEFIAYTTFNGVVNYVQATAVSNNNMTFKQFTTNKADATRFKVKNLNANQDGATFNLFDVPTDGTNKATYTVEEVTTPSARYEKLKKSVTVTTSTQTNKVSYNNEFMTVDANYSTATLDKQIISSTIDSSTADGVDQLAEIYGNTKFVIGYWGSNSGTPVFRFFTNGYKSAAAAFSGDLVDIGGFTDKTYVNGDGSYYLPTRLSNNKLVFDWERTSEDISDAYIFDIGTNHNGTEKCDRFGEIYINLMPLWDGEAKEIFFIEVKCDSRYGYLKGSTEYTVEEVTNFTSDQKRSLSGVMQLPATTIGGITCPAGYYPIAGLNGTATAHNNSGDMANAELTYPVAFRKVNAKTGEYVTGATFGLYDADKQLIAQTDETDKNGYYGFTGLIPGVQYYIKEIVQPAGFTMNNNYYSVLREKDTAVGGIIMAELDLQDDLEIPEQPYYLTIEVNKYDQINGFAVDNITFDIIDKATGSTVGNMTTDKNGYASYTNLPLGKVVGDKFEKEYTVVERQDADYIMVDAEGNIISSFDVSATVADIESETNPEIKYIMDVPNTLTTVDLTVYKVDEYNNRIEGCIFDLTPAEDIIIHGKKVQSAGELIGTLKTDEKGIAKSEIVDGDITTPMIIYANHKYNLTETFAPAPYVPLDKPTEFTATSTTQTVISVSHDVTIPNTEKKGSVHVIKKTEGQKNVSGIKFTLSGTSDSGRQISESITTDDNGDALFENIPIGKYTLSEDETTVAEWYIKAADQEAEVKWNETTDKTFYNTEKKGSVHVIKTSENQKSLSGIEFTLTGTSATGRTISESAKTDDNGDANFTDIPLGTYTLSENGETVSEWYLKADDQTAEVKWNETTDKTFYNELKKGSVHVIKTTEGQKNVEGIEFTLSGTSNAGDTINETAETDESGNAVFPDIPLGTYTLSENGETVAEWYIKADDQTTEVTWNETTDKTFYNTEKKGSVHVIKKTEGQKNVSGIEFTLTGTSATGNPVNLSATTDDKGDALFENIPVGTYTLAENGETVSEWYITPDPSSTVVTWNETTDKEIYNTEKEGSIEVHKRTEGMVNLDGIDFVLTGTSNSGREITRTATTDDKGIANFTEIPVGTYEIYEKDSTVPSAYLVAEKQSVTVSYAETTVKEFFNKEKEGSIKVNKRTEGMVNLDGIKFILSGTSDSGREITRTATTDEKGLANFTDIPIGTYEIVEDSTTVPYAYLVAEKQSVTVSYAQTTNKTFFNDEKEGSLYVEKHTEGDLNVSGITFVLKGTSDTGRAIEMSEETDDKGKVTFTNIPIGTYEIFEEETQFENKELKLYAYLAAEPQSVTITHAQTTNASFFNDEKTGGLQIQKRTKGMVNLDGIKFILSGTSDSGREIYQEKFTDDEGKITFEKIPIGTYDIFEDADTVPVGYLVADPRKVEIYYSKTTDEDIDNDETVVEFSKLSLIDSGEIEGATLVVFDKDGNEIERWVSGKEAHVIEAKLAAGETYTLHEEIAPDGYVVANDVPFTVNDDGSVTSVKMFDDVTKVRISKKAITGDDELPGAKLKIVDEEGNTVEEWVSTKEPHYIEGKLKAGGKYKLIEDAAPDGYVISNEVEFTVNKDGSVTEVKMTDDTTKVKISKKSITSEDELPGAKLIIIDKDGNTVEEWTSTNEAHFVEGKLKAGETYTLREITAPDGYEVANDVTFTVNEDGTVTEVTMHDAPKPDTPPHTSAGVSTSVSLMLLAMASLLVLRKSRKAN